MTPKTIASIIGARPQFIKGAVVSAAIKRIEGLREFIIHSGQHYDYLMSEVFFQELKIDPPVYNLGVGSGNHGEQTGMMMQFLNLSWPLSNMPDFSSAERTSSFSEARSTIEPSENPIWYDSSTKDLDTPARSKHRRAR